MKKILTKTFNGVIINFYERSGQAVNYDNGHKQIWIKRHKIGKALDYAHPNRSSSKLHNRHKERLNKYSITEIMENSSGAKMDTVLYNPAGVMLFCFISATEKAMDFLMWYRDIVNGLR